MCHRSAQSIGRDWQPTAGQGTGKIDKKWHWYSADRKHLRRHRASPQLAPAETIVTGRRHTSRRPSPIATGPRRHLAPAVTIAPGARPVLSARHPCRHHLPARGHALTKRDAAHLLRQFRVQNIGTSGFTYLTNLDISRNKQSIFMYLYVTFADIFVFYEELFRRHPAYLFSVTEERSHE